ncbi:hypothetical protein HaLaN_03878 [Haematococcus lacustris]|uniref:Uncharacterized protein n=1 Tax=Haematococcus lacustris TaxID=44745 RepID=A0A699YFG5_HAELA|nr:hypothetical protein HaLaN_03878 [Haematococcus lacustris]
MVRISGNGEPICMCPHITYCNNAQALSHKHDILPVVREFKNLGMHFNPSSTPAFAATRMRAGMFLAMRQACKCAREYGVLQDPYALCHLIRASPTKWKQACSAFSGLLPGLPETLHRERCSYAAWFKHGDGIGINHMAPHLLIRQLSTEVRTSLTRFRQLAEFAMISQNNNENLHDFMLNPCASLFVLLTFKCATQSPATLEGEGGQAT